VANRYCGFGEKKKIVKAVATAIEGISGVVFVDYQRAYDTGIGPEKMPGGFVNDIRNDREQILVDIVKNTLSIGVVLWTRAAEGEILWDKIDTLVNAATAAIRADPSLGSQTYDVEISRVESDNGSRHPVGVTVLILTAVYYSEV